MHGRTERWLRWSCAGAVCLAGAGLAQAATPLRMAGAITGFVTDAAGVPQMGAAVILFNRQERQFERALTDERGAFRFLGLTPDLYSIKVTLAAFVPALKKGILVQPGMASVLNVNLNTLFSSIQFAYPPIENGSLMSDEWKWVLRSASPTRPVLRFNGDAVARSTAASHRAARRSSAIRAACSSSRRAKARWPPAPATRPIWARRSRWRPRSTATICCR